MELDYFLFVFMVSLGVFQLAASWVKLDGILFFPRRYLGYIFAAVMISGGYGWFFGVDRKPFPRLDGYPAFLLSGQGTMG